MQYRPDAMHGWPLWKRVNMFVCTFGGGFLGFYLQDKAQQKHKTALKQSVPELEAELNECAIERKALELLVQEHIARAQA
jgi:hypothetical protein